MGLELDQATHTYKLDGKIIPGVTQILDELVPIQYKSSDWYLQRGRAVHACAAFIARGIDFDHHEDISGQVAAIRKFFDEVKPEIIAVEKILFSEQYRFAGTLDLFAKTKNRNGLYDYKSSISVDRIGLQLGAYSLCLPENILWGYGIKINDRGKYFMTKPINLKNYRREFLALRATYAVRERLGLNKKEED